MAFSVMSRSCARSLIAASRLLMIPSTPSLKESAFLSLFNFFSARPNFAASVFESRNRNLGGCTSLRGFRLAKVVAPPVSAKPSLRGWVDEGLADVECMIEGASVGLGAGKGEKSACGLGRGVAASKG